MPVQRKSTVVEVRPRRAEGRSKRAEWGRVFGTHTEERGGVFVHAGVLAVSSWQLWASVVTALVVVVLHIQVHQFGVVNA